jgi:hypothetical protein
MKSASQGKVETDNNEIINDVLWYNLGSVHLLPVKTFIVGNDKLASPKKVIKGVSVSMGVSTVETNRDRDQYFSTCQEQLLKVLRFSRLSRHTFEYSWSRFLKLRLFQSRLGQVEIVMNN